MKTLIQLLFTTIFFLPITTGAQEKSGDTARTVYRSDDLVITRLSPNVYLHTSFFHSETFGKVPCNGMVVTGGNEAVVFDTPADDKSSAQLIDWLKNEKNYGVKAVIPTHFHEDCVGGLNEFHKNNIASYATTKTIALAKDRHFPVPVRAFKDSLMLVVGGQKVWARFFGEGHTKDNVVGYYPAGGVLFGGCLVKELGAGKGNLADANTAAWPKTVAKVKAAYPEVKIVIPGHGVVGDKALLDYTMELFSSR